MRHSPSWVLPSHGDSSCSSAAWFDLCCDGSICNNSSQLLLPCRLRWAAPWLDPRITCAVHLPPCGAQTTGAILARVAADPGLNPWSWQLLLYPQLPDYCCSHNCRHPRCTPSAARTPAGLDIHVCRCPLPCTSLFSAACFQQPSKRGFKSYREQPSQRGLVSTCTRSACKFSGLPQPFIFRDSMWLARAF